MNQILKTSISNKKNENSSQDHRLKFFYKLQFYVSISLLFIILIIYFFTTVSNKFHDLSAYRITNSYDIAKLYNNVSSNNSSYSQNGIFFTVIGMIEIPKIGIYYPIISEASDDLLKIAPCRVAGPMPNHPGNLCIAGHNYDNSKFFSKLSSLEINDEIKIFDISGNFKNYKITKTYEVVTNDLSPLAQPNDNKMHLTLITCNNFNSNSRIIIKAIQ